MRNLIAVLALMLVAGACGGGGYSSPSTPSAPATTQPAAAALTVKINANGVDPRSLQVPMGGIVTFVNTDSRTHQIMSDPHPTHNDCPSINDVSTLAPGQSRPTGSFMVAKACSYHDHMNPDSVGLQGVLLVGGAQDPGTHY
jgi:plastocyanin